MARPRDELRQLKRRDQFLDAAESLLKTVDFEDISLEDVIRTVGLSKGAFYHYFPSKAALLEGIAERMADRVAARLADSPVLGHAADRLSTLLSNLGDWKLARIAELRGLLVSWLADGNAALRVRLERATAERIAPLLAVILQRGIDDGEMSIGDADGTARLIIDLVQDVNERVGRLIAEKSATNIAAAVTRELDALESAIARITAVPAGSIHLADRRALAAALEQ